MTYIYFLNNRHEINIVYFINFTTSCNCRRVSGYWPSSVQWASVASNSSSIFCSYLASSDSSILTGDMEWKYVSTIHTHFYVENLKKIQQKFVVSSHWLDIDSICYPRREPAHIWLNSCRCSHGITRKVALIAFISRLTSCWVFEEKRSQQTISVPP